VLAGMVGFARTVPDRMKLGRSGEVALAAKVHLALLRDPRLKGADIRLGAVQGGDVCLETSRGNAALAELARRAVERVPGVASVRIEDGSATTLSSDAPAMVAGSGAVADVKDGTVDAGPAGDDVPVRV